MAESKAVEKAADELYGLPPGEFTRARDARVKELRKEDREAADAVKGLRKPSVAAWALNQLARRRPKDLDRLLAAGEDLRSAQEELLAGGDRAAFQEAAAKERELVAGLSGEAAALAGEAGQGGTGLQEKVAETLHAAALDAETAEELRSGRLVREREAIGGFGATAAPPSARKAPPKRRIQETQGGLQTGAKCWAGGRRAPPAACRREDRRAPRPARARGGRKGARPRSGARRRGRGPRRRGGRTGQNHRGAPQGGQARGGRGAEGSFAV